MNELLDMIIAQLEKQVEINEKLTKQIWLLNTRLTLLEREKKNSFDNTVFADMDADIDKFDRQCKEFFEKAMKHGKVVE